MNNSYQDEFNFLFADLEKDLMDIISLRIGKKIKVNIPIKANRVNRKGKVQHIKRITWLGINKKGEFYWLQKTRKKPYNNPSDDIDLLIKQLDAL